LAIKICNSISPTFFPGELCPICKVKFSKLICRSPNAIRQKKSIIMFVRVEYVVKIDPRCQFHQRFFACLFVRKCFSLVTFWRQKSTFARKTRTKNFDEIDYRCQFHQRYTYEFFVRTSFFYVHVTRENNVRTKNSYA